MAGKQKEDQGLICPRFHRAVEVIGRRWSGAILRVLQDGPTRFGAFKTAIPDLSDRLLSERLKELEEFGLIHREVSGDRPVVVTYSLTPQGKALKPALDALGEWASKYMRDVPA
ncbi:MAG TPA: helix-turn-helix domain-containing protein [bacterium]|nr:helix-turn-helix domain-containing protein [bacterium]